MAFACSRRGCKVNFDNEIDLEWHEVVRFSKHPDCFFRNGHLSPFWVATEPNLSLLTGLQMDHLSDSDQGYHYEQYNPPVIDRNGFLTFPWTSRKPMPPGTFNPDEFTYADAAAGLANSAHGHAPTSRSQNQVNNSDRENPDNNGEQHYFAEKGANIPTYMLKKGNRKEVSQRFSFTLCLRL
jgi:hypothetical protein